MVPKEMVIEGDLDLINPGGEYPDPEETYLAFNLQCHDCGDLPYLSSMNYILVMNLVGDIVACHAHNESVSVDALHPSPVNSKEFYMGMNVKYNEDGPLGIWNWGTGDFKQYDEYGWVGNSHDLQWAQDKYVWHVRTTTDWQFRLMDVETGKGASHLNISGGALPIGWENKAAVEIDVNHFQFDSEDSVAYMSFRDLNAFVKTESFELEIGENSGTTAAIKWVAGSHNGSFAIVDLDGTRYEPGTPEYNGLYNGIGSLWAGHHNLEHYGNGEFMMFDNAYDDDSNMWPNPSGSRMLIVQVDEVDESVTLVWEHSMGYNTSVFGDNDRLPTGNLLGCAWPHKSSIDTTEQTYDAEIVEVVRETGDIAWNMKIWGDGTRSTNSQQIYGWMMYSVERVYEEPIIINPSCTTGSSADTLTFDTFNNFKMASDVAGEMTVVTAR